MPQTDFPWTGGEAPTFAEIREKPATYPVAAATLTVAGGVLEAAHQAHSTAPDIATMVINFNALLDKLYASGAMSAT